MRYTFDKGISRFTVQAFSTGLLSAFGHNPTIGIRDFKGEVQFTPETYDKALLRLTVDTATLELQDEMKKDDREKLIRLMFTEVLDVRHFPEATFESSQIKVQTAGDGQLQASVAGVLTLRGVSQNISFNTRVREMGAMLRISGDFRVRQSEFGITPVSFAGGALRLKDELKFTLEIVARQEEES